MRAEPLLDRDPQLEPGEVAADAPVDAEPERAVPVDGAVDHERVGIGELTRVAVRRPGGEHHTVAGLHRAAGELGVVAHHPRRRGDREVPQELLDRDGDARRVVAEVRAVLGVLGEVLERVADDARRRCPCPATYSSIEISRSSSSVIGRPSICTSTSELRMSSLRSARRCRPALGDHRSQVAVDRARCVGAHLHRFRRRARRCAAGRSAQPRNVSASSSGSPIISMKIDVGNRRANRLTSSHCPVSRELVDQLDAAGADGRLHRRHGSRAEPRVDRRAVRRVLGRVDLRRDPAPRCRRRCSWSAGWRSGRGRGTRR